MNDFYRSRTLFCSEPAQLFAPCDVDNFLMDILEQLHGINHSDFLSFLNHLKPQSERM